MKRVLLINALAIIAIIAIADILCYFFLPASITSSFPHYRQAHCGADCRTGEQLRFYHLAHPERGYDIAPNRTSTHAVDGFAYPVWSNHLGCFDVKREAVGKGYYYFAGDSFTWGFTDYENKFATIFESSRKIETVKCGVIGTGQSHQFSKFKEVAAQIGHFPARVVIMMDVADFTDDYVYPNSTVMDGHLVNTRYIDGKLQVVSVTTQWLEDMLARAAENEISESRKPRLLTLARQYSFVGNLLNGLVRRGDATRPPTKAETTDDIALPGAGHGDALLFNNRRIYHSFRLRAAMDRDGRLKYSDVPYARNHRAALEAWKKHADQMGYDLTVVLIPPKDFHDKAGYYTEVRQFLSATGIQFLDLSDEFRMQKFSRQDLYWPVDGHLSVAGNRTVGRILAEKLP